MLAIFILGLICTLMTVAWFYEMQSINAPPILCILMAVLNIAMVFWCAWMLVHGIER